MNFGVLVLTVVTSVLCPTVAWLVKQILSLRKDLSALEARQEERQIHIIETIKSIRRDCDRHQHWAETMQVTTNRTDKNVVALCQKAGVDYLGEK